MTSPAPDELLDRTLRIIKSAGVNKGRHYEGGDYHYIVNLGPYQIVHYTGGPYDDISVFVLTGADRSTHTKIGGVNHATTTKNNRQGVFGDEQHYRSHKGLRDELLSLLRKAQLLEDLADV